MQVEFVMVADAAQVVDGKLYLLGGAWNQYRCAAFPVPVQLSVVTSILVEGEETDRGLPLSFTLADGEGVPIIPEAQAELRVGRQDGSRGPYRALFSFNAGVQVHHAGRYTAQVVAGDSTNSTWFDVIFVGKKVELLSSTPSLH